MIRRVLALLAAAAGPTVAVEFDPATYRTLHCAGEIQFAGTVRLNKVLAYCEPLSAGPTVVIPPPDLPPAAASAPAPERNLNAPEVVAATAEVVREAVRRTAGGGPAGPHYSGRIRYYLNALAVSAKLGPGQGGFPVGAIIVKEKWQSSVDAEPTLITVMEKLNDAKDVSSWSFRMFDCATRQDLTAAYLKQASTSCVDCHSRWENTGFISPTGNALMRQQHPQEGAEKAGATP